MAPPKPATASPFIDLGVTGLRQLGGYIREEYHRDLQGERARRQYHEMSLTEPVVRAMLFAVEKLVEQVKWEVQGEEKEPEATPQEQIDFIDSCVGDMDQPWSDVVTDTMSMVVYGFSVHEVVLKRRLGRKPDRTKSSKHDDGKVGWAKMAIRKQRTIYQWDFVEGTDDLRGVYQQPWHSYRSSAARIYIPYDRFLLFRTTTGGGDPEGISALRGAYRPWHFKKRLEEFESIGVERDLAGIPMVKCPARIMSSTAQDGERAMFEQVKDIVRRVRADEHAGIVLPSDTYQGENGPSAVPMYSFELVAGGGTRRIDPSVPIERKSREILMCMLADFILLGHEKVGSFSLSSDKTDLFAVALGSFLKKIAVEVNERAIPALLDANAMPIDHPPRLVPGDIERDDVEAVMKGIEKMAAIGWETLDLQNEVRRRGGLPQLDQEELDASMEAEREMRDAEAEAMRQGADGGAIDNEGKAIDNEGKVLDNERREAENELIGEDEDEE